MTIKEHQRLQKITDSARPGFCSACGVLIAIAPNKNGLQEKHDLDDESNPLLALHRCPMRAVKSKAHEKIKLSHGTHPKKSRLKKHN